MTTPPTLLWVRILDTTHDLGRYATRLFADLGAEVIRIEPPGGLPDRQRMANAGIAGEAEFSFMNASKRSLVLDPASNAGRQQLAELARSSQPSCRSGGDRSDRGERLLSARFSDLGDRLGVRPMAFRVRSGPPASDLTLQARVESPGCPARRRPPLRLPGGRRR